MSVSCLFFQLRIWCLSNNSIGHKSLFWRKLGWVSRCCWFDKGNKLHCKHDSHSWDCCRRTYRMESLSCPPRSWVHMWGWRWDIKSPIFTKKNKAKTSVFVTQSTLMYIILYLFEDLWGCPEGYYMLQHSCYKFFNRSKSHAAAQHFCENQGVSFNTTGNLAKPFSYYHVSEKELTSNFLVWYKSSDLFFIYHNLVFIVLQMHLHL